MLWYHVLNSLENPSLNDLSDTKFRREPDKQSEAFTVDPNPLPETTMTVKHNNIKNMFNRSYVEAATLGAGSIGVLVMVFRYSTRK
jgi:hypothetical protein